MLVLFLALQQYLLQQLEAEGVNYIRLWNNQLNDMVEGTFSEAATYNDNHVTPFIFIEFVSPMNISTLGNGNQVYEDLFIKLHLIYDFTDAQDGTMGQDLLVLQFAQAVYVALQDWMPSTVTITGNFAGTYQVPVGSMVRMEEEQDFNHSNLYHFIQTYKTNYVDSSRNRPIGGQLASANTTLDLIVNPVTEL